MCHTRALKNNNNNNIYIYICNKPTNNRIKYEYIKEIIAVKGKPDIIDIKDHNGMATSKGCQRREYQN